MIPCGKVPSFADLVSTLCIETDGSFTPMGHGFSREYVLGRLGEGRLGDLAQNWVETGTAKRYAELVKQVKEDADRANAPLVQNMAQSLRRASYAASAIAAE